MARRLKGGMPRLFKDNRCPEAKRLREIYDDIEKRFPLSDGLCRRMAGLAARAWVDYEAISRELNALTSTHRLARSSKATLAVSRLRRRQSALVGSFLGGLRTLESMTGKTGGQDLAKAFELAMQSEACPE